MARPRIASSTPRACAGCYGQYPGRVHVDFASAIEGAQLDPERPRAGHVEWVVLCENCVRNAHNLLPHPEADRLAEFAAENAELRERLARSEHYAETLEDAIARRPEREHQHPTVKAAPRKRRYEGKS